MREEKIGLQCEKCLNKGMGRYCSNEHSIYYRPITDSLFGNPYPWGYYMTDSPNLREKEGCQEGEHNSSEVACPDCGVKKQWIEMSIDHIIPIASGGLEFDRNNLQWMCLSCNCRKSGGKKAEMVLKKRDYEAKQTKLGVDG